MLTGKKEADNGSDTNAGAIDDGRSSTIGNRLSPTFQLQLVGEGLLVGIVGGGVVTLYRWSLTQAEQALRFITGAAAGHAIMIAGWFALLALICFVVCKLMLWEPYTQGSGIPQTDAEVIGQLDMPWYRVLPVKFVEGTLCAFAGLSLGREGPSVQLGAVSGKAVSRGLKRGRGEERLLMTCGAAAGMSAAFGAPLTGVLFALEEIHKEFTASLILSVMTSSVAADYFVSQVLGLEPVLRLTFIRDLPHGHYLLLILLGIFCGVMGGLHNKGMFFAQEKLYGRIKHYVPYARLAIPFAIAGVAAFCFPSLMCGGEAILELIEDHHVQPFFLVCALLIGKYLFTTASFASGAPGGTLFPLVVMGMLVGEAFGLAATHVTSLPSEFVGNFVVMGIAGLFSAVMQAPVTGVVLAFELTGSLDALLSVSIVSIVSYATVKCLDIDAFYEYLLGNLLSVPRQKVATNGFSGEKVLHVHTVGTGSKIEGKKIKDIAWPVSMRVVTLTRAGVEIIPTGDTTIEALDELLCIMSTGYEMASQQWLWHMCRGSVMSDSLPHTYQ